MPLAAKGLMSTGTKIPLAEAKQAAERFISIFKADGHEHLINRWLIAGSIRRKCPMVGDVEHVVMPNPPGNANLFWRRLEALTSDPSSMFDAVGGDSPFSKAVYSDGRFRWGPKYRGVMFDGLKHEIFLGNPSNWGCILAIRTGPAELGPRVMAKLNAQGVHKHDEGHIKLASTSEIVPVPTENVFFELCGEQYVEPEHRS